MKIIIARPGGYGHVEGEVIRFCDTIINDKNYQPRSCPALIVNTGSKIEVVPMIDGFGNGANIQIVPEKPDADD